MRNWWLSAWSQKIDQKSSLISKKIKDHPRTEIEGSTFEKAPYLEPEEIGREDYSHLLVKSYKNLTKLINRTFHQLRGPSVPIRILQNTSTSSEFISSKNQTIAQCRQSGTFCKELAKADKRSYDPGCGKGLWNPFYFASKAIKATKFVSLKQRSGKPSVFPFSVKSRKYVRFQWKDPPYEFSCLCFELSPAPLVFTKLSKFSFPLLRKRNVRIIIYLDDMLLMASSLEDLLMERDTLRYFMT